MFELNIYPIMNSNWANTINNGLITQERRTPPVATGMITKPLAHEQHHDMKHDRFEVIGDHSRNRRLKFTSDKYKHSSHRSVAFLPQD